MEREREEEEEELEDDRRLRMRKKHINKGKKEKERERDNSTNILRIIPPVTQSDYRSVMFLPTCLGRSLCMYVFIYYFYFPRCFLHLTMLLPVAVTIA